MWILVFYVITASTPMTGVYAPGKHPHQFAKIEECVAKGKEIGDEIHEALPTVKFKVQCMRVQNDKVEA